MSRLDIRILGSLEVSLDGRGLELGTLKQRALLSLLLINRDRAVSTERILMALWGPDAPPDRRSDVWVYVSRLRKALEPAGNLVTRLDGGYRLDVPVDTVDGLRFESLAEEGRQLVVSDPPAASLALAEALALWRGDAYAEFASQDFAAAEVARLEEIRLTALELRIRADLAWMDPVALIPEIESLVTMHPLRPSFTGSLMLALYRRGRQADALRAYQALAERLGEGAGLEPPADLRLLEERILMDDPAINPVSPALPVWLPEPIASFVGRAVELVGVTDLLRDHRLVVLTGPGGVGKTTLALEVGRRLALQFDDAAFVDLTKAEGMEDVTPIVATAFRVGTGEFDALIHRLGTRGALAVFDNCEVMTARAVETVVALLERAPGLRVLATSRTNLGIPGEQVVRLSPMGTGPGGDGQALLRERIAALPDSAAASMADSELLAIVELTEGLPLAIELAAAQLSTWSAADVIDALDDPLEVLVQPERKGPARHRTLRTNIAWSERFLPAPASDLLARLSVFRSGFRFEAVGPVAGFGSLADGEERQHLRRLVDGSLVQVVSGDQTRYRLMEPVRDYAKLRLVEAGHSELVAERHARHYLGHLEELGPHVRDTAHDGLRLDQADTGNLLAAIRWAIAAGDEETAQRAAAHAVPLLRMWSDFADALAVVEEALAATTAPSKPRAELLFVGAPLWALARGRDEWLQPVAELSALADLLEDGEVTAWAAMRRADVRAWAAMRGAEVPAMYDAGPEQELDLYRQAATAMRDAGSPYIIYALHQLAWFLYAKERWAEAELVAAEWLTTARSFGWSYDEVGARDFGVWLALAAADHVKLETEAAAVAAGYRRHGDHRSAAALMSILAIGSLQQGDAAEALRRIAVGSRAKLETGAIPWIANDTATRACIHVALGDHREAAVDLATAIALDAEHGDDRLDPALAQIAARVVANSDPETAATILGAAERVLDRPAMDVVRTRLVPALDTTTGDPKEALRAALGEDAFEALWDRGASLDPSEAEVLVHDTLGRLIDDARA